MRVEDAGARTWLLTAAAGWALLAWALALFGMGGRIAPLPNDPSLVKPIPTLPTRSANRLGPIEQYAEIGARPLFADDRRPKPFSLQGEDEGANASQEFDSLLTSVLITPNLSLAILQPPDGSKSERVKLGEASESHPAWRLSALNARSAVFDGPGGQRTLELRVFDGTGGQPPTAIAREGETRVDVPIAAPTPGSSSGMPTGQPKPSQPSSGTPAAVVGTPATGKPTPPAPATSTPPMTEQAQMEAIRQRIQARRALMRQQAQPPQPPAKDQ